MLRITVREDGNPRRLELAGKLGGPWVPETENAWRAMGDRGQIEVDLTQVTCVDEAGRFLLKKMLHSGALLIARGFAITALVDEIKASAVPARRRRNANCLICRKAFPSVP
jgi:hypothetical protein